MKLMPWAAAIAALCLLSAFSPLSAATVVLSGTGLGYNVDMPAGLGDAIGEVTDGTDLYNLEVSSSFDPSDPTNAPVGSLLITDLNFDVYLDGLLESIEIGNDYVALLFGDLVGTASATFGKKVRVVFSGFDWNEEVGLTDVEVQTVAPVPLPAGALLLLSGLGGLAGVARLRRSVLTA